MGRCIVWIVSRDLLDKRPPRIRVDTAVTVREEVWCVVLPCSILIGGDLGLAAFLLTQQGYIQSHHRLVMFLDIQVKRTSHRPVGYRIPLKSCVKDKHGGVLRGGGDRGRGR